MLFFHLSYFAFDFFDLIIRFNILESVINDFDHLILVINEFFLELMFSLRVLLLS